MTNFYKPMIAILLWSIITLAGNADFVDPRIGTGKTHFISMWRSEAATYPGAVAPHGMVQVSPQTSARHEYLQGYYAWQDTIRTFSLAEHFSGWPNGSAGKGVLMPFSGSFKNGPILDDLQSSFSRQRETVQAGRYSVYLMDSRISCEFAALTRSILARFTFAADNAHGIYLAGAQQIDVISDTEIRMTLNAGRREFWNTDQKLYLYFVFNSPFTAVHTKRAVVLYFIESEILFKYGGSYTRPENAKLNVHTEIPKWDFQRVVRQSGQLWDEELGRIEVTGIESDKIMFYTALYHASLLPLNATDVNGQYPGFSHNPPLRDKEIHYRYFTPWDAFRTLHPLVNLIDPLKGTDFIRSMMRFYRAHGQLPEPAVMTGVHISVLVADALAKGIHDFDVELAFQGLREMILDPPYFRPDVAWYDSLGYVPYPHAYATTATLEFAFNDWALAQIADELEKDDIRDHLLKRSFNYRHVYHPKERFMLTRDLQGDWTQAPVYAEADRWNMSWFVPHNTQDLINLMGGDAAFCDHLQRNFQDEHYVLDNECPMNFPFLFSFAGRPWQTMKWKSAVLRDFFNPSPGGIPGNDDWGSMSSWFLWGALGLFPACPDTDELVISGPIFDRIVIHRTPGTALTIQADGVSPKAIYVQHCTLGETRLNRPYISQKEFVEHGSLQFGMGTEPNIHWGTGQRPFSLTTEEPDIQVTSLSCDPHPVHSNETMTLRATLENKGATGSKQLKIREKESILHSEWVMLKAGEMRTVDIPLKLYSGGKHHLTLDNQPVSVQVHPQQLSPADAVVFSRPDIPVFVDGHEHLEFHCSMQNISGFPQTVRPQVFIDDQKQITFEPLSIAPGETTELSGTVPFSGNPGMHWFRIDTSPEAKFKVAQSAREKLVLHYHFDTYEGRAIDQSGFGNHGEFVGGIEVVDGIEGRGIRFESGYIRVPESKSLDITGTGITLMCWYRPADEQGKAALITKGGHNMFKLNGKWQLKLAIGGWGRGQCFYNAKSGQPGEPVWLNQWSHFAGVGDTASIRVFYNGKLKNQLEHEGAIGHTDFEWRIGSNAEMPLGRTPSGVIDEVMIFSGALAEQEIAAIFAKMKKPKL